MILPMPGLDLARIRDARSGRVSSWDQRGRNQDYWIIGPGETRVIADLDGPGAITHIWMTQFCRRHLGPGLHRSRSGRRRGARAGDPQRARRQLGGAPTRTTTARC